MKKTKPQEMNSSSLPHTHNQEDPNGSDQTQNQAQFSEKPTEINELEVSLFGFNFDELGKVFSYKGRIFRGIYPEKTEYIKALFDSGLIQELIDEALFPNTTITSYQLEGFDLILEHEKISPILYPSSWTFDMLKDAALAVIKVNQIARKYGYQTLDSHGFNVLFRSAKPLFVDLGSFVKNDECPQGWKAYEEFLRYYLYPLKIYSDGNNYLAKAVMSQGKKIMTHGSYYQYKYPLLRLLRIHTVDSLLSKFYQYKSFSHFSLAEVEARSPKLVKPLLVYFKKKGYAPLQKVDLEKLAKRVRKIKQPNYQSQWGDYHDKFIQQQGKVASTPRFDRIVEIINQLKPQSLLEIGGNQGVFSQLLLKRTPIKHITCSDYDENAVNKMYLRIRDLKLQITPSLIDIVSPLVLSYGPSLGERYKSDMIVALALTHHVILTQRVSPSNLFKQFNKFTSRYVVTEFMPMGLYSEEAKRDHTPPDWYTEEWFAGEFEKYYTVLYREKLEKNRVLFVGEIKE